MLQFNVHDAKTRFSKILSRVEAGEAVLIAKNGHPVAKLVPLSYRSARKRPFGTAKKAVRLSADWNVALAEAVLRDFES